MCNKESYEHDNGDLDMRAMHPLWEEYTLPGDFVDEHRFFYFSPYSGGLLVARKLTMPYAKMCDCNR